MAATDGEALTLRLLDECAGVAEAAGFLLRPKPRDWGRSFLTTPGSRFTASMLRDLEGRRARRGRPSPGRHDRERQDAGHRHRDDRGGLLRFASLRGATGIGRLTSPARGDGASPPLFRQFDRRRGLLDRRGGGEQRLLVEGAAPISWSANGRPVEDRPAGTAMPGRPAMLTVTVKTSFRYISIGSDEPFSPMPKAADGVAGVRMQIDARRESVLEVALDQRPDSSARWT